MVASLNGVIFDQVYGDNSGGAEFDTDGDGTATQEDEFVSFQNTTGAPIDISGYEIWSDSDGGGAPDNPTSGLYHTFPPGTVLQPGQTLYIINEISGPGKGWNQEASSGGVESGSGGTSTNLLGEGNGGSHNGALALVDPSTGDYLVFNFSPAAPEIQDLPGFTGTTKVGEIDGASVQNDQNAGSSYRYDSGSDSYTYSATYVPCFAAGTGIETPNGVVPVEQLRVGDLVTTLDHGPQVIRAILRQDLDFEAGDDPKHKAIEFKLGCLGAGVPSKVLVVSPQHRMLVNLACGRTVLAPAKGLTHLSGVRVKEGQLKVTYLHLVFADHQLVRAEGAWSESFYPGPHVTRTADEAVQDELREIFPQLHTGEPPAAARKILRVGQIQRSIGSDALLVFD